MKLFFRYMSMHFRSQMQYRASFWMITFGNVLVPFAAFAGVYFLFGRFGSLQGWTLYEAALCFGVIHMAYSLSDCFARGFDTFAELVAGGDFDRLLVRPRGTVVQVLGSKIDFTRFGHMLQAAIVLGWAASRLPAEWTLAKAFTLAHMVAGGTLIFTGVMMLAATMCFWTIEGLEIANIVIDGGREMTQYPLHIYHRAVMIVCTFVIPFGCVSYWPLLYVLGKTDGNAALYMMMPLAGALFFVFSLLVWRLGVRRYRSTGS
jgi:ABC-2 type transport system permease protein